MKVLLFLFLAAALTSAVRAQTPAGGPPEAQYTPDQLDQLLAPIALYPDPLVALILPASTVPADVASAAQFVGSNPNPAAIDAQAWAPSVKGLAHYSDVLKWMNDNTDWMHSLGAAFAIQPSDVMKSVQQLRAKARAAGTLVNTPQQQVDIEGDDIRIVPAQDNQIYVPQYDPQAVYDDSGGAGGPYVTFGAGYPVGPWLGFECDWEDYGVWFGPWHSGWAYRRDWRDPRWGGNRWHPDARRGHDLVRNYYRPGFAVPRPGVIAGAHVIVRAGSGERAVVRGPEARPDYRGWNNGGPPRPATPAPQGRLYGSYGRGTQARDFSTRGHESRQAPVRSSSSPPAHERASAPASSPGRERR